MLVLLDLKMDGFDEGGAFFSDNFFETTASDETSNLAVKKQLKEFIRDFHHEGNFEYKYRNSLKNNYLR